MQFDIRRVKGTYVDKETGETKDCYNYILVLQSGGYIRINPVFKADRRTLNAILPIEDLEAVTKK